MKSQKFHLALVTAPDLKVARKLARSAVVERLAACVSLVPRIESHYWWQGKVEVGSEVLMIIKTTSRCRKLLEKHLLQLHPYDTPEFITLPITGGNHRYLDWLAASVTPH